MNILRILRIIGIVVFSLFFFTEIFLRICCDKKLRKWEQPKYELDSIVGFKYKPNSEGYLTNTAFKNHYKVNRYGFIGDDFSKKRPEGVFRIIVVGASDDTRIQTDGPWHYIPLTQKYLNDDSCKVEIISCAIEGNNKDKQRLDLIEKEIINYDPNIILLSYNMFMKQKDNSRRMTYKDFAIYSYGPDYNIEPEIKYIDDNHYSFSFFKILYDTSYIYRYMCKYCIENNNKLSRSLQKFLNRDLKRIKEYARKIITKKNNDPPPTKNYSLSESTQMLTDLSNKLKKHDIELILFNKYSLREYKSYIELITNQNSLDYFSLNITHLPEYSFGDKDCHTNQTGHKVIAEKLYKTLTTSYIPKKYLPSKFHQQIKFVNRKESNVSKFDSLKLFSFKLNNIKNDQEKYQIAWGTFRKIDKNHFANQVRNVSIANKDFINITPIVFDKPKNIDDLILSIDSVAVNHKPNLLIVPIPYMIPGKEIQNIITKLDWYNSYLKRKGIEILFYSPFGDVSYKINEYIFRSNNIPFIRTNYPKEIIHLYESNIVNKNIAMSLYNNLKRSHLIPQTNFSNNKNLALNKTVNASSTCERFDWSTRNIVNGIRCSIDKFTNGWLSISNQYKKDHEEWVQIDLGEKHQIDSLILYPSSYSGVHGVGFPVDFKINLSTDGQKWETIITRNNFPTPKDMSPQSFKINQRNVQFVKIEGTKLEKAKYKYNKNFYRMSFAEVEVYGQ